MPSDEMFSITSDGKKVDADLHAGMLKNASADALLAQDAIERAVQSGMSHHAATQLYSLHAAPIQLKEGK